MKKLLAAVLSLCLALSLCAIPAMATTADFTTLIEECLTSEVSTAITKNLNLPEDWGEGTSITWESSNPSVIGNDGTVTRGIEDATVTLTAKDVANPGNTKELTFTVLSLFKKVWYNENFYKSGNSSELNNEIPALDDSLKFVEAGEGVAGKAGFYNSEGSLSVQKSLTDANDYALLGKSSADATSSFDLAFPAGNTPKGKVSFTWTVTSKDNVENNKNRHRYIRFFSTQSGNKAIAQQYWLNATSAKLSLVGTTTSDVLTGIPVNGDIYSARYTTEIDLVNYKMVMPKPDSDSYGTYYSDRNTVAVTNNGDDIAKINFWGRQDGTEIPVDFYIDDIVITTESTEIPGETAEEKLAIYKRLLENKLNEIIADKSHVNDDINLDVLDIEGYDVTWESSNSDIVAIDTANKKANIKLMEIIDPDATATLTGTISHDGATDTITLPLTVKPYGSVVKSLLGDVGTTEVGKVTYDDAVLGSTSYNTMHKDSFSIVEESGNKCIKTTGTFRYGAGSSTGAISGAHRTASADIKIVMPEDATTIEPSFAIVAGGQGPTGSVATVYFRYSKEVDGSVSKNCWVLMPGGTNQRLAIDDSLIPDLGEWFNLQIVTNNNSQTWDLYVDGQRINEAALSYPNWDMPHPQTGDMKTLPNFYTFNFNSAFKDLDTAELYVDNIELIVNDATLANNWADMSLASIDSVVDELKATVNGTAIAWTATGDATVNGNTLVKSNDFYGEAVVTATATVEGKGTLTRAHNIYYGTEIKEVNTADGKLNSIKYVSDTDATGYIAYYNGSDALLRVAPFAIQAGRNTRVFDVRLPEGYASFKVFAWNENLSPLNVVYQ